jgi:hypothetical protein
MRMSRDNKLIIALSVVIHAAVISIAGFCIFTTHGFCVFGFLYAGVLVAMLMDLFEKENGIQKRVRKYR